MKSHIFIEKQRYTDRHTKGRILRAYLRRGFKLYVNFFIIIGGQRAVMEKKPGKVNRFKKPLLILAAAAVIVLVVTFLALAALFISFFYYLGTIDDPFHPGPPLYQYELTVSGLDGFTTVNGSAVIMVPLPAQNGSPVLAGGWWVDYPPDYRERRHGMTGLSPTNTPMGPMLAAGINMTDYYESYAGVTPMAILPGQNESELPHIVPARVDKPWSFDNLNIIASGSIGTLDDPTSEQGRQAVIAFLQAPLVPAQNGTGNMNYTTYVYIDPELSPKNNDSTIRIHGALSVVLNHNKVNASEEGMRRFEYHTYTIDESIPAGVTGYVPINISCSSSSGTSSVPQIVM